MSTSQDTVVRDGAAATDDAYLTLTVPIARQPDDTTCGPTCLHTIYRYYGEAVELDEVIAETVALEGGGTLDVFLACDALRRGFDAAIYTYNLTVFDPSWFGLNRAELIGRLRRQREIKHDPKLRLACEGYINFLDLGGRVRFVDLSRRLLRRLLSKRTPILTGLSATYLYRSVREHGETAEPDDVRGEPAGHFVVLSGYNRADKTVRVSDPYLPNPSGHEHEYWVHIDRLIGAILLGVLTYDANLLVITPGRRKASALAHTLRR